MNNENLHEHQNCCDQHQHGHNENEQYHTHEHTHTHQHSHAHQHEHNHTHDYESGDECNLNKEEKTLKILLAHWVEHNKSHETGFKEWVEKSKTIGKIETSEFIQKAVEFMEKADEMLVEAQKHM